MTLIQRNLTESFRASRKGLYTDLRDMLEDAKEIRASREPITREFRKEAKADLEEVKKIVAKVEKQLRIK